MIRVVKTAEDMATPLCMGTEGNYAAVKAGRSALARHEGDFGLPEPFFASLFADRSTLPGLSLFDSMVISSASRAVSRAGIDPSSPRVRFILSTIKGDVESLGSGHDGDVLPAASARRLAAHFGNPNTPLVVSNACISGVCALIEAMRMLRDGLCDHAVVVGCELQSRFIISGFQCLKAVSDGQCMPFDAHRRGLNAGEAVATMVLSAREEVRPGEWELVCGAVRNDANHISGPSRTGEGSYNCLRSVLPATSMDELAFVNVHGTATAYNDEMESIALERAGLSDVPVNALKGCYGHTMGAAGVLETLLSMRALEDHTVLATRGFETPGTSRPVNVSAENRSCSGKTFIKLLSGFGGCNAAVLCRLAGESSVAPQEPADASERTCGPLNVLGRVSISGSASDLSDMYHSMGLQYPKFFKMDTLSKAGFIASEMLLKDFPSTGEPREDCGVLLFSTHGPYCDDCNYIKTIADTENFFPSPALFVYTLANIVTGEIAIRNRFLGESNAVMLPWRDGDLIRSVVSGAFSDPSLKYLVTGWVDCRNDGDFEAELEFVTTNNQ